MSEINSAFFNKTLDILGETNVRMSMIQAEMKSWKESRKRKNMGEKAVNTLKDLLCQADLLKRLSGELAWSLQTEKIELIGLD